MEIIDATIPIDISKIHGVVETIFVEADFSPKEIRTYTELFKDFHDVFS
jgi:hypothetical protein